jgi:perosamine synthetase
VTGATERARVLIPIARPDLGQEELDAVADVVRSGLLGEGQRVATLEERWAERVGVSHAVAMSNGTVALTSILTGLGIGPGDEVITVAHTFVATANAILWAGATPVFVDIEPDTYLIDAKRIGAAITARTKAIMPVHLFGLPADMDMIQAIADRHGLAVVEDACQASGARFRSRAVGSFGHGAFSLGPTSNATAGEGGIVTTNDARLAGWLRAFRNHGLRGGSPAELLGHNRRLSDLAAAIGLVQLGKLGRNIARRQAAARTYDEAFANLPVRTPITPVGRSHVFHRYPVHVGRTRDAVLADLLGEGIGAEAPYPLPVHRQPYIQERGLHADLPVTDAVAAETIALPMFAGLRPDAQQQVGDAVISSVERHAATVAPAPRAAGSASR